jgi:hypothetical protein
MCLEQTKMKNNKEFIWLCPRGNAGSHRDFLNGLVQTYSWMESNQIYLDKIVIINYTRQQTPFSIFPVLSATNKSAITFTGALYWATEKYLGNSPRNP